MGGNKMMLLVSSDLKKGRISKCFVCQEKDLSEESVTQVDKKRRKKDINFHMRILNDIYTWKKKYPAYGLVEDHL